MVKCEYHNRNTKIRGRSILTTYILSTYIFWIFWVKDNDLVTIGTFDIFSTAYIISALFRLSTIILFSQNRLSLTVQCHIFFYIIGLKKITMSQYELLTETFSLANISSALSTLSTTSFSPQELFS